MKSAVKFLSPCVLSLALTLGLVTPAAAYVGPGAGLSLLGALWALLAAVFAALGFVLLWPIRRLMKKRKGKAVAESEALRGGEDSDGAPSPSRTSS